MKKLSIIIPAKNEEDNIVKLLNCIKKQTIYNDLEIILSDANSTDNTILFAKSLIKDIKIISGGLPAKGRNEGAKIANSDYILFLDSDIFFDDIYLFETVLDEMIHYGYWCSTVNIQCHSNYIKNLITYELSNIAQKLSKYVKTPFATGMFMMVRKDKFFDLGKFDETIKYAEDYHFSKRIPSERFSVIKNRYIYTIDRRFKNMGTFTIIKMFLKTMLYSFFNKRDGFNQKYFEEK